ncbi:MAG: sulfotransferase [Verrucomicrobiota bacterium]
MRPVTETRKKITTDTLTLIELDDSEADLELFPRFLIIGPQRTGTTWLSGHLGNHPEIYIPPEKELYYFSNLRTPDRPAEVGLQPISPKLSWYLDFFRLSLRERFRRWRRFGWVKKPLIRGEACASYAASTDSQTIDEILMLRPDLKVVMLVRDPLERAWSHAKKDLSRDIGRPMEDVGEVEFREFVSTDYQLSCSQYVEIIDRWSRKLRPGNFFVGDFNDIARRPRVLFENIACFLGVQDLKVCVNDDLGKAVNPTEPQPIPLGSRKILEEVLGRERIDQYKEVLRTISPA